MTVGLRREAEIRHASLLIIKLTIGFREARKKSALALMAFIKFEV